MRSCKISPLLFCILYCLTLTFPAMATDKRLEVYPPAVTVDVPQTVGDGIAFLCTIQAASLRSVTVSFLGRSITAQADKNGAASVLLPVPLDHADTDTPLAWKATFSAAGGGYSMPANGTETIKIRKRAYPVQKLTVAPKYVTPDPELKERIDRERKLMGAALTTRTGVRHWELPMARPVPGKITSLYGLRRVFNGQPRNPHKGLDFRAPQGDPIAAIDDGTVVLTGDFYYAGRFVVVDHGLGVVSIAMHMSEIVAEKGQFVKRGDIIGLVGSTGRSTGPHLHLGISVLGQSIDALPLIAQTEADKHAYAEAVKEASQANRKADGKTGAKPKSPSGKKSGAASGKKTVKKKTAPQTGKPAQAQGKQ